MLSKEEKVITKEVYSSKRCLENLTTLCDDYGGRFAGTEECNAAAEYILGLYEDYGLSDPHLEPFKFMGCRVGNSSLTIKGPVPKQVQTLTLPMTPSGTVEGSLVSIGGVNEVGSLDLDGKIILATNRLNLKASVDAGAVGFVWMHPVPMMGPPTGVVAQLVPSVSIKHEDGLMLKRFIEKRGEVDLQISAECETFQRESNNVCGEVKGSGGGNYVLLGGHYDGHEIAQAAFDCGAACMAVTEMGRILAEVSDSLKGDVRVVCFSAEEFGYLGSRDYAIQHSEEMKDMRFTYQLDCNGGPAPQMVTIDYWTELEPFYKQLVNDLNLPVHVDQRMGPGDSRAFHELGIPTGSIIDYREPGRLPLLKTVRHTIYDTVDKINLKHLQDDIAIGTLSTKRILENNKWPAHRSKEAVEEIRSRLT
jgi:Iap family predicted aminopeptidase